jgi:hypothetical protein
MSQGGRHDWAQAELRCLMCGRVLGRLVGPLTGHGGALRPSAWGIRQFAAFSPAEVNAPAVRLSGSEQFRCSTCGGGAVVDEVETFSTYDAILEDELEERPRRGRRPRPWRAPPDERLRALGLAG